MKAERQRVTITTFAERVATKDLGLGDVVQALDFTEGYATATVCKIEKESVHLFRPYTQCADFECGGTGTDGFPYGYVITYIGQETYALPRDARQILRFRKGEVR